MTNGFINSLRSEWIKKNKSLAWWLVVTGGLFMPTMILLGSLFQSEKLPARYADNGFWEKYWHNSWESMAMFLLPMGIVFATALMAQLEFKNNAWKLVNTLPVHYGAIFFSKLAVLLLMMLQFFVLFNVGGVVTALVPPLLFSNVPFPAAPFPWSSWFSTNLLFGIASLPIVALQFLLSLRFRNFLVPVGLGFGLWLATLLAMSWKYSFLLPYCYPFYQQLKPGATGIGLFDGLPLSVFAVAYFVFFTACSYVLYATQKEKG